MPSSSIVVVSLCSLFVTLLRADYEVILNHKDVANGFFSSNLSSTGLENADNPDANTYSIIGNFDAAKRVEYQIDDDALRRAYQLKLQFTYADGTTNLLEWTQTSWITEPTITGFSLIQAIGTNGLVYDLSTDPDQAIFRGLGLNVGPQSAFSYLDGSGAYHGDHWQAVGNMKIWSTGFPGMHNSYFAGHGAAQSETLWIYASSRIEVMVRFQGGTNGWLAFGNDIASKSDFQGSPQDLVDWSMYWPANGEWMRLYSYESGSWGHGDLDWIHFRTTPAYQTTSSYTDAATSDTFPLVLCSDVANCPAEPTQFVPYPPGATGRWEANVRLVTYSDNLMGFGADFAAESGFSGSPQDVVGLWMYWASNNEWIRLNEFDGGSWGSGSSLVHYWSAPDYTGSDSSNFHLLLCENPDVCTQPTSSPTLSPTISPTSPTISPTSSPTSSPTISPTISPTFCFERFSSEIDVDEQISNLGFQTKVNDSQVRTATNFGEYLDTRLAQFNNDQEQELQCVAEGACLGVHAIFENNTICNVVCNASFACSLAQIQVQNCQKTEMICNGVDACTGAKIEVESSSYSNALFELHCGVNGSCHGVEVYVLGKTRSQVSCYDGNACDGMLVDVNAGNYKNSVLNMYSFSANVTFSNGFGLEEADGSQSYVNCNTDRRFLQFNESSTDEALQVSILNEYKHGLFPCDGVTIECFADNNTEASSCYLDHEVDTGNLNVSDGCDWVAVSDITLTTCRGECISSPTKDPTPSPTREPTSATSNPTNAPTDSPSFSPTNAPSQPPTVSPTSDPTQGPSRSPSFSPSSAPSFSPTESPTQSPSFSPSSAPSFSPTKAPTRVPTEDVDEIYDVKILIDYALYNLSVENKRALVSDTKAWTQDMEEVIERGYYDPELLLYTAFWTHIYAINEINIEGDDGDDGDAQGRRRRLSAPLLTEYDLDVNNIEGEPTIFSSEIQCTVVDCGSIIKKSKLDTFLMNVGEALSVLFDNNTDLVFGVSPTSGSELEAIPKFAETDNEEETGSVAVAVSIGILSGGSLASAAAFMFNRMPQTKIDNAAFLAPFLLSIGVYDFISDINLSIQMFGYSGDQQDDVVFILAVLSVFFIVLPLSANVWYACKISSQPSIRRNPAARAWFAKHLAQFMMLSFGCAGTYPILVLCSSRIFGLEFFDAGLLSADLYELSKIKIRSTIFLENIPQLVVQIVYSIITFQITGQIEDATALAFVASVLSIAAAMVVYEAQRKQNIEMDVTQYFVAFVHRSGASLTDENRAGILLNKGKKEKLAKRLAAVFSANDKAIEIGFVFTRTDGCIVHLQHAVFKDDLEQLQKKLYSQQLQTMAQGLSIQLNVHMYGQKLYEMHERRIDEAFRAHFEIDDLEFVAMYHESYGTSQHDNSVVKGERTGDDVANEMVKHLKKVQTSARLGVSLRSGTDEDSHSGLEMTVRNQTGTNQPRTQVGQTQQLQTDPKADNTVVAGGVDEDMMLDQIEKLVQQQTMSFQQQTMSFQQQFQQQISVIKQQLAKKPPTSVGNSYQRFETSL